MLTFWEAVFRASWAFGPFKSIGVVLSIFTFIYFFVAGSGPFWEQVKYERAKLRAAESKLISELQQSVIPNAIAGDSEKSMSSDKNKTGNINVTGNSGPTQINIGSPGSQQIVNQARKFNQQAKVEKLKRDGNYILQISLTQTSGIWDQGTVFHLGAKVSAPYKEARIVQGLPPALFDVRVSENKETGVYSFSTISAPYADRPVVLEIVSENDLNLEALEVNPVVSN